MTIRYFVDKKVSSDTPRIENILPQTIFTRKYPMVNFSQTTVLHLQLKILANIQVGVICVYMVDFHRPGHINVTVGYNGNRQIPTYVQSSNHTCVYCMSMHGIVFCGAFDMHATCFLHLCHICVPCVSH